VVLLILVITMISRNEKVIFLGFEAMIHDDERRITEQTCTIAKPIAEAARLVIRPRLAEHQIDCLKEGTRKEPRKREPQVGESSDNKFLMISMPRSG
jgi:hypothetical protein